MQELYRNKPFPSCFELQCENEARCKVLIMKIGYHTHINKTNLHMSLVFAMRFKETRTQIIRGTRAMAHFTVVCLL